MNSPVSRISFLSLLLLLPAVVSRSPAQSPTLIPRTGWSLLYVDSQETAGENAAATNAFDGDPGTFWHSQWQAAKPPLPHEIQLDLGATYPVSGFRYLPRQDGKINGRAAQYELYLSTDGVAWGTAVATGTLANVATEQEVLFTATSARYTRFRVLTEWSGSNYRACAAELRFLQTAPANQPPDGSISSPTADATITAGDSVTFAGSGTDPDANTPLTYRWSFGAGSGVADSTQQNPGAVRFDAPGTFTVTLTVTDALGLADPTPASRTVVVQNPPLTPVPQSGWTLRYVDSQETVGENAPATAAFDGSAATFWHSQWSGAKPPLPHELQIDLGATYNLGGFRYLPRQDGKPNGRIGQFEFYVSDDPAAWGTPVATGTLADTAAQQEVQFAQKSGRYIRLRALSDLSGTNYRTCVAELGVLATSLPVNQAPDATIDTPAANVTIKPGDAVNFTSTGTDPDGDPLTYRWTFGSGSGIADATVEDPGALTFANAGTFTVTLTATDSHGAADASPATRTITVKTPAVTVLSRSGWVLSYADSEETSHILTAGTNGVATNAFDGNVYTMWHTDIDNTRPSPPHLLLIDLGAVRNVCGFRYLPRQDAYERGRIGDFEFFVSTDGSNWGTAVATGRFPNTEDEKQILFAPKSGRYVKLRAVNEVNSQPYTSLAEFNVLAATTAANSAPTATITSPATDVVIPEGGSVEFAGTGSDPDGSTPLTYRWTFGTGADVEDATVASPGFERFERAGTYTVQFVVADAYGAVNTTPATRTITVQGGQMIPTTAWTVRYVDSQETGAGDYRAIKAFDGNPATFWETQFSGSPAALPHELQIDLGAVYNVNGFTYLPRQDNVWDGRIGGYEFYLSLDGTNWGDPATAGTFPNDGNKKEAFCVTTPARYVRLRALSEVNGNPYTSMAEFEVKAAPNVSPSVVLLAPRAYDHQNSTDLYALTDASLPAGHGVRFTLDGGHQTDVYSVPFEAMFTSVTTAEHVVDARVIDASGVVVAAAAGHDRATQVGIGDYYVAMGDSITYGFGDDIPGDNISGSGRNRSAGYTPILETLLTADRGHPVAIFNEGLPGEASSGGAARVANLLQAHPEAQCFLVFYGANDTGIPRASGRGLAAGASGYAGTFKDYMQQIVTAVRSAGKQIILAKAPPVAPVNGTADQLLQDYNAVIDELVADPANGITVSALDLYTYFSTRTSTHYIPDPYHPNGLGYQAMAQLWFSKLSAP